MAPFAEIGCDVQHAAHLLENGELVAIPTETVYGLAGNALDERTVAQIYKVKQRPYFDPLIVHCGSKEMVHEIATFPSKAFERLAEAFWPGPLTLLLPRKPIIPDIVTAGLPTVGVRLPSHPLSVSLLHSLPFPLAAPSANPFGYVSPTLPEHVFKQLGSFIPYILDGGPCTIGIESSIVGRDDANHLVLYRPGKITLEMLKDITGEPVYKAGKEHKVLTPGMLKSHYAPTKRLILAESEEDAKRLLVSLGDAGLITFGNVNPSLLRATVHTRSLSEVGNLEEAACRLFSVLRAIEDDPVSAVVVVPVPQVGLGIAIHDRLKRASITG